jgi:hypothetical protein
MFLNRIIRKSGQVRFQLAGLLLSISFVLFTLASSGAANRHKGSKTDPARISPNPPVTIASDPPNCILPGVSLITDATGDTGTGSLGTVPGTPAQDITEILFAEPYVPDGVARMAVTIRLADLSTLPASGIWRVFFKPGASATTYFVGAFNDPVNGMQFNYGTSGTVTTTLGAADGGSISVSNKTITILISNSKVGSPTAGTLLSGIYGRTQTLVGAAGTGATPTHDLAPNSAPGTGTANYTLVGNAACSAPATSPTPTPTPTATPTPSATPPQNSGPQCSLPGVQVQSDPSGDQTGAPAANSQLDLLGVYVAEPFVSPSDHSIIFTIKVSNLTGGPQTNSLWAVYLDVNDTNGTPRTIFFDMNTIDSPTGGVGFNYGYHDSSGNDTSQGPGSVITGSFTGDGTITLKINTANPLSFSDFTGAHQFDVNLLPAGTSLTAIQGQTQLFIGIIGNGGTVTIDTTDQGTGTYLTQGNAACQASGSPTPTPTVTPTPTPIPTATPGAGQPRFFTYLSPQGVGDSAGEPSIGSNWTKEAINHNHHVDGSPDNNIPNGGTSLYFGGFLPSMVKVTWDECSSPAGTLWENKPLLSANTPRVFGDPILFTDSTLGRTFVAQLEGLTPAGSTIDITDNDGDSFIPSDGVIPSDVDHQTIGGGIYHSPLPNPNPVYAHAIYYASQSIAEARALRSDNGGILFSQAAAPMFTIADCSGLHGHIKVSPADGTVYVPDKGCGGDVVNFHEGSKQTLVLSQDNGITWTISEIPDSTSHGENQASHDPSVGVATDGTVYLGYQDAGGHPKIAVTHDKGATWSASYDVGASVINGGPVLNCAFPAVVAGDPNRAAFAFFGSETGGDNWHCGQGEDCSPAPPFPGVWYLYVATTFDGGTTWFTQNVTPGDPIQRGGICGGGDCRNLLDFFDATIDKEGRVVVGYDDGCISASCISGGANDFTAKAAIARQSGGPRMFALYDPVEPTVPGAPAATGALQGSAVNLSWPIPDSGGSAILGYNVYRKNGVGPFTLIATTAVNNYTDASPPSGQNVYHVTAFNAAGEGPYCPDVTPSLVQPPNICGLSGMAEPGVLVDNDLNPDGSDNDSGANTPPDPRVNVRQLFISEPCFGPGVNKLVFTMQLAPSTMGSAPASSQWYIVWNRPVPDADFDRWFVGMKTDVTGATSFVYGKFGVPLDALNPNPNANTPMPLGDADSGTYDVATGVVTIILSNSKAENVSAGQSLAGVNVRTYLARPDAGQKSQNNASDITGDSTYTLSGNASCCVNPVPLLGVASRKTHGTAGTFDVALPLTGTPGIECRAGQPAEGNHKIVFTFANPITGVAGAEPSGMISSRSVGDDPHEYVVNLTGVSNAQTITVTLTGITDTAGNTTATVSAPASFLLGDTTENGQVNSSDVSQTQAQSGITITGNNFREDVTVNGSINSSDISLVQSKSGTGLP